jgi:hypothetical protein
VSGWVREANCEAAARPRADIGCAFDASGYAIYQVQGDPRESSKSINTRV